MPKPLLRLVPLLAFVALLAGCVRVDLGVNVHDDGSGTVSMLAAIDQSVLSLVQQAGQSAANPFDQLEHTPASQLPPGAKVEPYAQDGFVGVRLTFPFAAGDDVAQTLARTFAGMASDVTGGPAVPGALGSLTGANGPLQNFVLRKQNNGDWRFEATVPTQIPGTGAAGLDPAMLKSLFANASFTVRLTLPGKVVQTNADERNGNELVWNIDPLGAPRTLTAVSAPRSGGQNALLTVLLVSVAGGGAVAAGLLARRH